MVNVAVTGAAGSVGRVTVEGLAEHNVTAMTHREHDDIDSTSVNITDYEAVESAFDGQDVVVHLAANPSPQAGWETVLETNIVGTYNVYEAARNTTVERVVFASTNHVQQMYNVAEPTRPGTVEENPEVIRPETPFRPDSYYGVSKVAGEALGNYYADRYGMAVINLRIGYLLTETELREKQDTDDRRAHYVSAVWLSPRDCKDGMKKAVTAPIEHTPTSLNLLSANQERYFSIIETIQQLDYNPRDDSSEVIGQDR